MILSHGGVASLTEACRLAAGTALSGPAGGVAAGVALSRQGVGPDLITFDMGGTSTDIAVIRHSAPSLSSRRTVGNARIALPALDIVTLGAGGGSIAHLDPSRLLRVGPRSAGAVPGPACYGYGGDQPTVNDANLILGLLEPDRFLGGRRRLDIVAARAAIAPLAKALGLDEVAAAAGIHRMINARMADAVRVATGTPWRGSAPTHTPCVRRCGRPARVGSLRRTRDRTGYRAADSACSVRLGHVEYGPSH